MASEVGSEVGGLAVLLAAAGDVADVDLAAVGGSFLSLLAIGTSAGDSALLLYLPIQRGECRA